jgi:DnaJ homolog subfamily C member 11
MASFPPLYVHLIHLLLSSLSRLGQRIILPVLLTQEFDPRLVVACTIVPSVSMMALETFYLKPRRQRRVQA